MEDACVAEAVQDIELEEKSKKDPTVVSPTQIIEEKCPNQCTSPDKGQCVKGKCICNEKFTAEDCSVPRFVSPEIEQISDNGLCDVEFRPCLKFRVYLYPETPAMISENLTCRVTKVKVRTM